jgi:hypothetical protein
LDNHQIERIVIGLGAVFLFGRALWRMRRGLFGPPGKPMSRADHPMLFWAAVALNMAFLTFLAWFLIISQLLGLPDPVLQFGTPAR